MSYSKEKQIKIIKVGFDLLYKTKKYSQAQVIAKLRKVNCRTGAAVMSRILNGKKDQLGDRVVNKIYVGYAKVMELELGQKVNENGVWQKMEDSIPEEIIVNEKDLFKKDKQLHSYGRIAPAKKVEFFSSASKEIIEFGLTLNTFSSYLNNLSPDGFRKPLIETLKKNVKIKCYLLDPEWNGTSMYFHDRESIVKEELPGIDKIRTTLRRLRIFYSEIIEEAYSKNFEVYTYRHFPSNYFLVVDRAIDQKAKMMVSNYLFGQKRVLCPVIEFSRADDPTLFFRYDDSLQKIIKNAKKVDLKESLE